ncbi:putative glycolipid-binding domain-containing protein [Pseudonocardia lacus]|uniref:putative glycolipid-binding domain-containing protein n=1 Tax=Pseudonocardia lacus TaxID=2835865 RepID=UPI0020285314|nr:putative glycolipid-binding domain-containing protein [Pseudonocardia lacus]
MLTWQAEDGHGLEGTRLNIGAGGAYRALSRMVRVHPDGDFTASFRLVVGSGGELQRLSITSATANRERHLTLNRTEDGYWLLDTGSGGGRNEFGGALDIDLQYSPMLNTVPIRRLDLHRSGGDHTIPVVFVSLPSLEVSQVTRTYRTVSPLDDSGHALIELQWDDNSAELVVDADGVVASYPGLATRVGPSTAPAATT